MSRPLRLEFAVALYHITSRGNGRKLIYLQDDDFEFLQNTRPQSVLTVRSKAKHLYIDHL